jgi:tRNA (guanine-N7-)-methyltransferase
MRTRKKKWAARELEENPYIIRDWANHSGRLNSVHLELGCGKGRFITQTALLNPGIHYIGIEREPMILASAARLAAESGCNAAFLMIDASELLDYFKPGEIQRLYINFCDPWPRKKKWAKRRLTHENYLKLYEQLLIPEIHLKTDNQILFEFSIESLSSRGWRLKNISLDLHNSGMEGNIMTEYEEKFQGLGMKIYRLEAHTTLQTPNIMQ